jgi:hypothetical protein
MVSFVLMGARKNICASHRSVNAGTVGNNSLLTTETNGEASVLGCVAQSILATFVGNQKQEDDRRKPTS